MSTYLEEILEQPEALKRLYRSAHNKTTLAELARDYQSSRPQLLFVGMGSSHYAGHVIRSRLSRAHIPFRIEEAGEVLHYEFDGIDERTWIVAISQSGESYETRELVKRARGHVARIVSITNEEQSTIASLADHTLLLCAGEEQASSTKTYLNSLLALHQFVDAISGERFVTDETVQGLADTLERTSPRLMTKMADVVNYLDISKEAHPQPIHMVARGPMFTTALQTALILAETTDLFASALPGGTFRHGPFELSGPEHRVVFFAPSGRTQDIVTKMAKEVYTYGSKVVLLSDHAETFPFAHIPLPRISEHFAPLLYFLPMELFGSSVALHRGRIPGTMKRMGKVTTME
ncbi:SIS domain-containing protein [Alicyclobacillus dauci]|uniref:Glutamine--fructose-6-phosphate aminotransferase [isomerizing] n=1 Tax=Alicyclobacillus dauci TaxID=1475485 RepID=A0ABY6YZJ3_9BACL|nr:SIS domain-containing protein [Alicyclobacillus dauci]WAH36053.1 SIS domain-containing protein [Alicyclobacillus dauci]